MIKQIITKICDGDSEIAVTRFTERTNAPTKDLSIWLCQGTQIDGTYGTEYHVTTFDGELDELINKLIEIRDKKELILKKFNKDFK